jgi:hypothetical protein
MLAESAKQKRPHGTVPMGIKKKRLKIVLGWYRQSMAI